MLCSLVFVFLFVGIRGVSATEITSTSFKILDPILDDGGTRSASASYILHGRVGETAIGRSTSLSYAAVAGSAAFVQPAAATGGTTVISGISAGGSTTSGPTVVDAALAGRAYPGAAVTILQNEQVVKEAGAGADGFFAALISAIPAGRTHTFGVYGRDSAGRISARLTYTVNVPAGVVQFKLSDIFLPPTVALARFNVAQGEKVDLRGAAFPQSAVTVEIPARLEARTVADARGQWETILDTKDVPPGVHSIYVRAKSAGQESEYSLPQALTIAGLPTPPVAQPPPPKLTPKEEITPAPLKPAPLFKEERVRTKEEPPKATVPTLEPPEPGVGPTPSAGVRPPPVSPRELRARGQVSAPPVAPGLPPAQPLEIPKTAPSFTEAPTPEAPLEVTYEALSRLQSSAQEIGQNIKATFTETRAALRDLARAVPQPQDAIVPLQLAFKRTASAVGSVVTPIVSPVTGIFTETLPSVLELAANTVQNTIGRVGRLFGRLLR